MILRPRDLLILLTSVGFLAACSEYNVEKIDPAEGAGEDTDKPDGKPDDSGTPDDTPNDYSGAITGRVCSPSGEWVAGATVYAIIIDDEGKEVRVETTTDADGYYTLEGLPVGQAITIYIEKGSFSTTVEIAEVKQGEVELPEEQCFAADETKIAVVTGQYDDIGAFVADLGFEFDIIKGTNNSDLTNFLRDPDRMATYDIIFFNCGTSDSWKSDEDVIGENLKEYVNNGGSIYASDWAHWFVESSFPGMVDWYGSENDINGARQGNSGDVVASVVDAEIAAILGGSTADLKYDLPQWVIPEAAGTDVEVLVKGTARTIWGDTVTGAPLALELKPTNSSGTIIYTSFHNESQATVDMEAILKEIILSL